VKAIQSDMKFVDFGPIQVFALRHPRAARVLSSIRTYETKNINKNKLIAACRSLGIAFQNVKGKMIVDNGSVMDFLEVLDRRLYQLELVEGSPETYRAGSRKKFAKSPKDSQGLKHTDP
jgi:hypothetical protein